MRNVGTVVRGIRTPIIKENDDLASIVIDSLMAAAMVGEGTSYENLTYTVGLSDEKYGVGFRKGSDLAEELNKFFKASYDDGSMKTCAEKYGVQAALIEQ